MALVGPFDASQWVEGVWSTYPQLPPGVTYYQPSMWWEVTVSGAIQGQTVAAGDLLFATQGAGRLYGANTYGAQVYGGLSEGNWTVQEVFFLAWDASIPGPIQPPYPNAGCPFTRPDLPGGHWAPGWRIVLDAYYNDRAGSRTYGAELWGDEVYGDAHNTGAPRWVDITQPTFRVTAGDGTRDGSQDVPVAEVVVQLVDETGQWLDMAEPYIWYQPVPGDSIRVGFLDPQFRYWPALVGQIERIEDVHDGDHPRVVALRAFGQIMDLTVDVMGVQYGAEYAATRFMNLVALAGWRWGSGNVVFPGDAPLIADTAPHDIVVRDELDRTVQSCGWFLDSDRWGSMRVRNWPHEPEGTALDVSDCAVSYPAVDAHLTPALGTVSTAFTEGSAGAVRVTADPPDAASFWRSSGGTTEVGRNPSGTLYSGQLRSMSYETTGRARLIFPGLLFNFLSVPDAPNLNPTGNLQVVAHVQRPQATSPATQNIVSKDTGTGAGNRGWVLRMGSAGTVAFVMLPSSQIASSTAVGVAAGAMCWVRATRVNATGVVTLDWAPDSPTEPTVWTNLPGTGTPVIGAIPVTTGPVRVGDRAATPSNPLEPFGGRVARVILRDGATTVLDIADNDAAVMTSASTFRATSGQTVTVTDSSDGAYLSPTLGTVSTPDPGVMPPATFTVVTRSQYADGTNFPSQVAQTDGADPRSWWVYRTPNNGRWYFEGTTDGVWANRAGRFAEGVVPLAPTPYGRDFTAAVSVTTGGGGATQRPTVAGAPVTNASRGEGGVRYQFTAAGRITQLRYQRLASTPATCTLRVWRETGSVKVAEVNDTQSTTGTFTVTLPTAVSVAANEFLIVTCTNPAAQVPAYGGVQAITNTANVLANGYRSAALTNTFPSTVETGTSFYVEPIFEVLGRFMMTAWDYNDTSGTWTAGTTRDAGVGLVPIDVTTPMRVGQSHAVGARVRWVELRTGLDPRAGTVLVRFDASEYPGTGLSFTDPRGRVWTMTTAGAIVPKAAAPIVQPQADALAWRFDAADYPPDDGLSFTDPRGRVWTLSAPGAITQAVPARTPLVAPSILFANDQSQLLNYVTTTNADADPLEVHQEDPISISRFGSRGRALGYPKTGLAFADAVFTAEWVRRVLNRFATLTRHIEEVDVDTALDHGWLAALAGLDTGRAIRVSRTGIHPMVLDGVVVGWQHEITPGRWTSALYTSTLTPSY